MTFNLKEHLNENIVLIYNDDDNAYEHVFFKDLISLNTFCEHFNKFCKTPTVSVDESNFLYILLFHSFEKKNIEILPLYYQKILENDVSINQLSSQVENNPSTLPTLCDFLVSKDIITKEHSIEFQKNFDSKMIKDIKINKSILENNKLPYVPESSLLSSYHSYPKDFIDSLVHHQTYFFKNYNLTASNFKVNQVCFMEVANNKYYVPENITQVLSALNCPQDIIDKQIENIVGTKIGSIHSVNAQYLIKKLLDLDESYPHLLKPFFEAQLNFQNNSYSFSQGFNLFLLQMRPDFLIKHRNLLGTIDPFWKEERNSDIFHKSTQTFITLHIPFIQLIQEHQAVSKINPFHSSYFKSSHQALSEYIQKVIELQSQDMTFIKIKSENIINSELVLSFNDTSIIDDCKTFMEQAIHKFFSEHYIQKIFDNECSVQEAARTCTLSLELKQNKKSSKPINKI